MKRNIASIAGLILLLSPAAKAANLAVITNPPTIFSLLVLIVAVAGLVGAFKVAELVRGGLLSKSWQMFIIGFVVLVLSQVASLLNAFEVLAIPSFVVPMMLTVMVGLFAYGVFEARRTLG
ncbi:MAG: hypothetical protein OEV49_00865 [candidate division Zixibacteria bacterium]|nr:hypothetical protein [candidate division Zixibacteria bacterium]MDH3938384.1 hypothetical protein [candidate division Zixibacteria bacterium]MDH4035165.1 hypothetical protein [candidate division Zixibacteria bacterium]